MQTSFKDNRYKEETWYVKKSPNGIPTYLVSPRNNKKSNTLLLFIPGLNGNGSMIKYFNYPYFDNMYLFSFDQRAQGFNTNKPSRFYKKYLKDLNYLIDEIKIRYPHINNIYLCGESWGSTLSFLFHKYYFQKINGVIGWNMPYKVVDLSPKKGWNKFSSSMKTLLTFLTSIDTYDDAPMASELTNNKVLLRIIKSIKRPKLSNKVILAAWRSFKKSWKYISKNNFNYLYIQSLEDAMITLKKVNHEAMHNDKIIIFKKGYHLLTFDNNVSDKLFKIIYKFIKIKPNN